MTATTGPWRRRFLVRGVFWRQLLRWAVLNVPLWIEPVVMAAWSLLFLAWGGGRRGILRNLAVIKPESTLAVNVLRAWRVFWNYAWTIADNVRFQELRTLPDWEFIGYEHFEQMQSSSSGAIILTAHMGSYDLGAHLFSELSNRQIVMVRAPEHDPETRAYEEDAQKRVLGEGLRVDFSGGRGEELAFDLLEAVQHGKIVAIQGDRVTAGISSWPATLFGRKIILPAGPFALAMAARVPIYPLFIIRLGRRSYQTVVRSPIHVVRQGRNRDQDLQTAVDRWAADLENVVREHWYQWFSFEPFDEEQRA